MRVIGIDPGYDRFGIAVLERVHGKETVLHSRATSTPKSASLPDRLLLVGNTLEEVITTYSPDVLALEQLFFNNNARTAIAVAEARGVALYLARKHALTVFEYSPQAIKIAATGYGKSEKKQVADMLHRLVTGVPKKALDDEYDAIAAALTCLVSERF
jgi:crossover junction endodeoxyribonuclease RuvC